MNEWAHSKPQDARILDVIVLGPFMIWFGANAKGMPEWARALMVASGALTIVLNGANYMSLKRAEEEARAAADPLSAVS